jgi:hypothetical protein
LKEHGGPQIHIQVFLPIQNVAVPSTEIVIRFADHYHPEVRHEDMNRRSTTKCTPKRHFGIRTLTPSSAEEQHFAPWFNVSYL